MDTIELNVKEIRWLNKSEKPFEPTLEKLWKQTHKQKTDRSKFIGPITCNEVD